MSAYPNPLMLEEITPLFPTEQEALRCFEVIQRWREVIQDGGLKRPRLILLSLGNLSDKISFIVVPLVASAGICTPQVCGPSLLRKRSLLDYVQTKTPPPRSSSSQAKLILSQLRTNGAAFFFPPEPVLSSLANASDRGDEKKCRGMIVDVIARQTTMLAWMTAANGVVFDIRVGGTSFIRDHKEALSLVHSLSSRCRRLKIRASFFLSHHSPVLGQAVGSRFELKEAVDVLSSQGPLDVLKIAVEIGSEMLILGTKAVNKIEAKEILKKNLKSGLALNKLKEIIAVQRGDSLLIEREELLQKNHNSIRVYSEKSGFLVNLDRDKFFSLQSDLGIAREKQTSTPQPESGLIFSKKRGDQIKKGDLLAQVFGQVRSAPRLKKYINSLLRLQPDPPFFQPLVIERIRNTDSL